MAFGRTDPDDPGSWQQKPPKITEIAEKEPPAQPDPPPAVAGPPSGPPQQAINLEYIANLARQVLPDEAAFQYFKSWSDDQLTSLTQEVVAVSAVDMQQFQAAMEAWATELKQREQKLNEKEITPAEPVQQPVWPPLPGVVAEPLCTSLFDTNELALRGRKSVLKKSFYVPTIFPQLLLHSDQKWAFGQKIEYRQEWRHSGFTLGELISSLSLLPNEELTLEVSSWQRTKTEIQEETNAERREKFEREQRRTDEESCVNEAAASNGWSVAASGSVSFGPASASVSATATGNTSERSEQAARRITEATSKAANEVSLKRAVKLTQTAEAGSEASTTRRIRNPNACHTVTYNFFQMVKLYDVQLRLENDAVAVMLPGIFPGFYQDGVTPVMIPYWLIEGFTSPALFLTQYFEVDRDLSSEIHGFALRVRMDSGRDPAAAVTQLAQGLIVATLFLLKQDPAGHVGTLGRFIASYVANTTRIRAELRNTYGIDKGQSEQITTPGIYVDSLLGKCTACEQSVEARNYVDAMRSYEEMRQLERANLLMEKEIERRRKRLEAGQLEPFEPPPPTPG